MAEKSLVMRSQCVELPDDLDDVTAAGIGIPGMSSWAALKERARLVKGETVLVNGATGTAGKLAIQIAKHLGAKKVIGTGRDPAALKQIVTLGADETVSLLQSPEELETAFRKEFGDGVNVVLDYLWGVSAERLIVAAAKEGQDGVSIRFIAIGSMSGSNITLPNAALRSSALELMGSGIGSIPMGRLTHILSELMQAVIPAGLKVETESIPLADVQKAWNKVSDKRRIVITIP
jgi:NADPH:quinone reductase-like Zn-dependent oxidoreductase